MSTGTGNLISIAKRPVVFWGGIATLALASTLALPKLFPHEGTSAGREYMDRETQRVRLQLGLGLNPDLPQDVTVNEDPLSKSPTLSPKIE
ncbi:hypothetical protein BC828DRAFT_392377 [Blastocladiella britannica]|nr:hypothetical protein BC828DRAFT_392377 [Blastocladiella britannica]